MLKRLKLNGPTQFKRVTVRKAKKHLNAQQTFWNSVWDRYSREEIEMPQSKDTLQCKANMRTHYQSVEQNLKEMDCIAQRHKGSAFMPYDRRNYTFCGRIETGNVDALHSAESGTTSRNNALHVANGKGVDAEGNLVQGCDPAHKSHSRTKARENLECEYEGTTRMINSARNTYKCSWCHEVIEK